ncbi:MAG: type I pullulanase [Bacteroidia bacterium]|nr:type I pullulanase [Bacteroidia bacterium]
MRSWKFKENDFIDFPVYEGDDLGVFWSPERTTIRIWAPTAQRIFFRLYQTVLESKAVSEFQLLPDQNGTWILLIEENLEGLFYTIQVRDATGWLKEGPDIYARTTGANGNRGIIIDQTKSNPAHWETDLRQVKPNPTDMVIYEVHIRDFSMSASSGIKNKGKYLGFTEAGTKLSSGESTGLDHLKELGISHVHLLPVADFHTVDELRPTAHYNWGYDPLNYNTPEGWYSTDPCDGITRIKELKMLVQSLHTNGIGVILDVVYNHTGLNLDSYFNQTVPGYFYRLNPDGSFSNGSGCGNEIATEREMVRRYIIESIAYWAEEFHIDGFRFDLMGLFDLETMNQIRHRLDSIDPNIFLYGEGWTADQSPLEEKKRAIKANTKQLDRIATFCDDMRNGLKGSPFDKKVGGFISGINFLEEQIKFAIVGAVQHDQLIYDFVNTSRNGWANTPAQCVNYVSCHDNLTLFDKLQYASPEANSELLERMARLAFAIIFTSQGVPFIHAGDEMLRSKGGNSDSYKSPDFVNQIEWSRKADYPDLVIFLKNCIELRRQHPAFRMMEADLVKSKLRFFGKYIPGVIAYELGEHANGDSWRRILVLHNGNNYSVEYEVPLENWLVVAQDSIVLPNGGSYSKTNIVRLHPIATMILAVEG